MPPLVHARVQFRSVPTGSNPHHLAFVSSTPYDIVGGSGTYVGIRELVRALGRQDVRVTRFGPAFWCPSYTAKRLVWNWAVSRRLRSRRFDWVVGFDLDGFHYGRSPVAPYIASIKGVIADELKNERGLVRMLLGLQAAFERMAVRRAAVVVATSQYSRNRIAEAYAVSSEKVVVVPELIDLEAWTPAAGELEREDPPVVLTVAHMYARKNLGTLLRAYALLARDGVRFRGWIVGDGPCRPEWERLRSRLGLEGQVEFLGTIPRAELADRYRRADVFCLPSRQEGFGIVFLEAMAHGLPIVAGRAGAIPETVPDGQVGLLAEPNDDEDLARCLGGLLRDTDLRQSLGTAGRAWVETFRADRVAAQFVGTVLSALEGTGRRSMRP